VSNCVFIQVSMMEITLFVIHGEIDFYDLIIYEAPKFGAFFIKMIFLDS
jgi:hypothetical protein